MHPARIPKALLMMSAALLASGCAGSPDHMIQTTLEQQARQNEAMVENTRQIAEASHKLVDADAQAREHLIQANREQQGQIQAAYVHLDASREALEVERRELARQRQQTPLIAETIQSCGLLLACLLPLGLAGYLLYAAQRGGPDEAAVSELLLSEIERETPTPSQEVELPRVAAQSDVTLLP